LIEISAQIEEKAMNKIHPLYQDRICQDRNERLSRRAWLRAAGLGFGSLGLSALLAEESKSFAPGQWQSPLAPRQPHFEPRAKRVIFLFMHGGPSGIDTFDPKDRLTRDHGKPLPIKRPLAFDRSDAGPLMKSPWEFRPGGKSGVPVSDLFPHVREVVDELCVIRSMVGEGVDHGAALLQTFTGTSTFVGRLRPGHGESEPPGFHRHQAVARARRSKELEFRLPARCLPGDGDRSCRDEGRRDP
jgi:hypothetical protein